MTKNSNYVIYNIKKGIMVSNFTVDFYRESDGKKPVGVFIRSLDIKMKAKVVANLHLLEEYGNMAREPLSKELEDGIFELRIIEGNDLVRILYFFDKDKIIIATNGFIKKQQKTPISEIDLAKQRRTDYHRRKEAGIYE
ncbi:type II toxin-antitoxin system RelE/ParE family toxin [Butyrivibrio sp. AE3004]|uniref:type II toxin-antitoxin system RelE/ParE family toxin n=1 Tax=Butyrivibrio sp. AE3004 TaxID=1506994 RepID=UPI002E8E5666|nr:type II toxin-antitoxin system RelE/ParE family toxin [Butyrivibrio sp. AE3004]